MDEGSTSLIFAISNTLWLKRSGRVKETGESMFQRPSLDDILTGFWHEEYGYKGDCLRDAMGMDAIAKNPGEVEAVKMAIKAGVDLVLMPTTLRSKADLDPRLNIVNAVVDAVKPVTSQKNA